MLSLKQLQADFENDVIQDIYWETVEIIEETYSYEIDGGKLKIDDILSSDPSTVKLIEEYMKKDLIPSIWFEFKEWTESKKHRKKHRKKDGRHTAKKDEDIRVEWICEQINGNTELGKLIKRDYYVKFKKHIERVVQKGGNNIHFDIMVYHTDNTNNQCEEKGTKKYSEIIDSGTPPYENSVQFSNNPGNKFTISKKYLKLWYDINVNNVSIKEKYNLPETPEFKSWLEGGPYVIWGDPKSEYSKILKQKYRGIYPGRSMGGESGHNIDYRKGPNDAFVLADEDKTILIKEVQPIYTYVMNQKDVWLQTTGTINGSFSFKWFDKIEPQKIIDVELLKDKDIKFKFILDGNTSFIGHMRWGNGCGFSCFRMDFK